MEQQYDRVPAPPRPFVKWAGGKRQLIPVLDANLPSSFETYFEPFLGGGALLFHILVTRPGQRCNVADLNPDLILAYITIRDNVDALITSLKNHKRNYQKNPKQYYYSTRQNSPANPIEKTSRLLFLNKTCFNGLYRVNSKGKFNVPLGRYFNPNIVHEENLRSVSRILQPNNISIKCRDFESVLVDAKRGDFVYFDPPYHPVSDTANFTSYTDSNFTLGDLGRLAEICKKLDSKGCRVLFSNSDSDAILDMFSDEPWQVQKIHANRLINSVAKKRTEHFELLIKNY